jgi:parallel beta-helix repeat protein
VSPQANDQSDNATLVSIYSGSKKILITNCKIYSIDDASVWKKNQDWYDYSGNGINSSGTDCLFKNNYLKNTWFSVELKESSNEFSYNIINWFGADAIRALDDHIKINYNQIKNATVFDYTHPTRPQHDDGIQSWTFNLPVKDVQIIGNQIVDIADPNLPLPTEIMQGIVDFDGFAEDWVVENNIVVTHHSHGIALYGATNCKVTNNTVIRNPLNLYSQSNKPWIRINPRKENVGGDLSTGNLVRNNIMASYQDENKEPGSEDHNAKGINYTSFFEDYAGWNFYLSENSPALNSGTLEDAPHIDLDQKRRDAGNIDAGCFERGSSLQDRESPSSPSNIATVLTTESSITLAWDESQDNTEVKGYEIAMGGEPVLFTSNPEAFISGLEPGEEYILSIRAVDYFGNISTETSYSESTMSATTMSVYYVAAHAHDQLIKSNSKLMWVGMPLHRIGGFFGAEGASAILPFKLPCLEDDQTIASADLIVSLDKIIGSPSGNVDVYGLGYRSRSDVLNGDHWQGPYGGAQSGTPITEDFITTQSTIGEVSLTMEAKSKFGSYLQTLYSEGAGCQDFTFVRLNSGVTQENVDAFFEIYASETGNSFNSPLLKIISSGASLVKPVEIINGVNISPNPNSGESLNMAINGFENTTAVIIIHDSRGHEVYRKTILTSESTATHHLNSKLVSGMYFVTVLGNQRFAQTKFVVI